MTVAEVGRIRGSQGGAVLGVSMLRVIGPDEEPFPEEESC